VARLVKVRTGARYPDEGDLHGQVAERVHDGSGLEDHRQAVREIRARKRQAKRPGKPWKQALRGS
jgi:hypothetical protein